MTDPVDEALKLIQSKPEGILQSELWKELGVDSRKCSRIVKKLEDENLIDRTEFKKDGIKTYLIHAKKMPVNPSNLLAGDELIPCICCELNALLRNVIRSWTGCTNWQLSGTRNNFFYIFFKTQKKIIASAPGFLSICLR